MGAGASAIPDKVSLEDAREIAGDKFDLEVFKANCDVDGFINRDILLQYDKKDMVYARTMPASLAKKAINDGKQLTQAESMRQLWKKATGGLGRPTSVKDLAVGFILTKRAAWSDPHSSFSPQTIRRGSLIAKKMLSDATSTPTAHHKDATTPSAKHHTNNDDQDNDEAGVVAEDYYDGSMDSNDSLLQGDSQKDVLDRKEEKVPVEQSTSTSAPKSNFTNSLRMNLAVPLTLDLNAPPANHNGLTLMTDTAGVMRSANSQRDCLVPLLETKKVGSGESYSDLLEGVDGIIEVDELEGSFMMTPRKDRGMTLNVNIQDEDSQNQMNNKSMMFTASGAIELKGIDLPIRDTGMIMTDTVNENHESNFNQDQASSSGGPSGGGGGGGGGVNGGKKSTVVRLPLQDRSVRLEKLGAGAAGIVYKAFDLEGLELVALKEIPIYEKVKRHQMVHELNSLYKNLQSSREQEEAQKILLKQSSSDAPASDVASNQRGSDVSGKQHVVAFIDAFSNLKEATVSLMVEYMNGGSLQNIVDAGGCDDHITLANIAKQSLLGLRFLHRTHNLHRDIKPANMLINFEGDVKISDFGIIRKLEHQVEENEDDMMDPGAKRKKTDLDNKDTGPKLKSAHTFVGTVTFMSPERINGESYSTPSDVWSLGLSLMTCALGKIPLRTNKGYWSLLQCVRDEDPPCLPDDGRWSKDLIDFCKKSMIKDPALRATCDELLEHPFLNQATPNFITSDGSISLHESKIVEESKEEESKEGSESSGLITPIRTRPRSESVEVAKDEIGSVLREGAENELDALLRGLYNHVNQLFESKRQTCLSLLNQEASEAKNTLDALRILLEPNAQPRRKVNSTSSSGTSIDFQSGETDCLDRLAVQLNLPISVVRRRVDLLTSEGPDAIKRYPKQVQEVNGGNNDVLFDTLNSSGVITPTQR